MQHIKSAVYQDGHCWGKFLLTCPLQRIEGGLILITGNPYGQFFLRLALHPGSYYGVATRKGAQDSANARKQL